MSSTDQIYHLAASRLGDKCDRSMTLGKLLENKAQFFIFISEVNMASRKQNCSKMPKLALLTHKGTFVCW